MQSGMAAQIAAADVDPFALQQAPVTRRRLRNRTAVFASIAVLAYLVGLIAQIPARTLITETDTLKVGGTIWNGEAVRGSTIRLEWQFAPLRSLTSLAFSADVQIAGGGTDLVGQAMRSSGRLVLTDMSGQIDGTLLDVMAPDLPLSCRFVAQTRIAWLALGGQAQGAAGTMQLSPATCTARGGSALPVTLPASRFEVRPVGGTSVGALSSLAGRVHLIELRLSPEGNLSVWPTAALVRTAPVLAGVRYDTRLD